MEIEIFNFIMKNGMKVDEISDDDKNAFIETDIKDGKFVILRSKKMIIYKGLRFRFNIQFCNGIIEQVSLVAAKKQEEDVCGKFKDENSLHEQWLLKNYGLPTKKEKYGYVYLFADGKISSEYDPRSGSSEIIFIMHS